MSSRSKFILFLASAFALMVPAAASAAPQSLEPLEIARAAQISDVEPHVSPSGRQFATYTTVPPATPTLNLIDRIDGGTVV